MSQSSLEVVVVGRPRLAESLKDQYKRTRTSWDFAQHQQCEMLLFVVTKLVHMGLVAFGIKLVLNEKQEHKKHAVLTQMTPVELC